MIGHSGAKRTKNLEPFAKVVHVKFGLVVGLTTTDQTVTASQLMMYELHCGSKRWRRR